jgi:hypothetical protein
MLFNHPEIFAEGSPEFSEIKGNFGCGTFGIVNAIKLSRLLRG